MITISAPSARWSSSILCKQTVTFHQLARPVTSQPWPHSLFLWGWIKQLSGDLDHKGQRKESRNNVVYEPGAVEEASRAPPADLTSCNTRRDLTRCVSVGGWSNCWGTWIEKDGKRNQGIPYFFSPVLFTSLSCWGSPRSTHHPTSDNGVVTRQADPAPLCPAFPPLHGVLTFPVSRALRERRHGATVGAECALPGHVAGLLHCRVHPPRHDHVWGMSAAEVENMHPLPYTWENFK